MSKHVAKVNSYSYIYLKGKASFHSSESDTEKQITKLKINSKVSICLFFLKNKRCDTGCTLFLDFASWNDESIQT